MRKYAIIILVGLILSVSCRRDEPVIADPLELALKTLSEDFMCQPLTINDNTIAIVNKNNTISLCSYDTNGQKVWQYSIDSLRVNSFSIPNIENVDLKKDPQNNLLLTLISSIKTQQSQVINYGIKMVKFNQNGQYLYQTFDSIHQRDTIIIGPDTIPMKGRGRFDKVGSVCLSGGNYAFVSSLPAPTIDSTFIQISLYNNSGIFVSDNYLKIPRLRKVVNVHATSSNVLILAGSFGQTESFLLASTIGGTTVFDQSLKVYINNSYFFQETNQGQFIISISYINSDLNIRGIVVALSGTGQIVSSNNFDFDPSWIIMSMREVSDGYLFCGFDTDVPLLNGIDWRTTFISDNHRAVILKTGFDLTETWHRIIEANYNSAGAVTIGQNPISFFGGKFESSGKKIYLMNLTNDGEIF